MRILQKYKKLVLLMTLCIGITGCKRKASESDITDQAAVAQQSEVQSQDQSQSEDRPIDQNQSNILNQTLNQESSNQESLQLTDQSTTTDMTTDTTINDSVGAEPLSTNQETQSTSAETTTIQNPDFIYDYNDANAIQNNQIAYDTNWLYYVESTTFYDTDLYRFSEGKGKVQKIDRLLTDHMMCWNHYLYFTVFLQEGDKVEGIYRYDPKTKQIELIRQGNNLRFFIHEDKLYVADPKEKYVQVMNMDGTQLEETKLPSAQYVVQGKYFYTSELTDSSDNTISEGSNGYQSEESVQKLSIVRYDKNGQKDTIVAFDLTRDDWIEQYTPICFQIYDDKLYYIDNDKCITAVNLDGSNSKTIIDDPVDSLIVDKDGTIYCTCNYGCLIRAYDRNGGHKQDYSTLERAEQAYQVNIIGITPTKIYYREDIFSTSYDIVVVDKKTRESSPIVNLLKSEKPICTGYHLPEKEEEQPSNALDPAYDAARINLSHRGYVASNSKWQFFVRVNYEAPDKLYQMKLDCSNMKEIAEGAIDNLICTDRYLYYSIFSEGANCKTGIYRYDIKKEKKEILREGFCTEFYIADNIMYYYGQDDKYIMKMNLKDKKVEQTKVPACIFQYYKQYFYSVEFTSVTMDYVRLIRYDLNGNKEVIEDNIEYMNDGFYHSDWIDFQIYNDRIYYIAPFNHSLHMISTDGTVKKEIFENKIMSFLIDQDGTIYSMVFSWDDEKIQVSDLNGNIRKNHVLKGIYADELRGLTKDYIFYVVDLGEGYYYLNNIKKDGSVTHSYE